MSRRPSRIGLIHLAFALFAMALVGKAAHVQLWQGKAWAANARRQQTREREVPAPRGEILDAAGRVLAQTKETIRLEIAPREVRDRIRLRKLLRAAGVSRDLAQKAADPRRGWVTLPGRWLRTEVADLVAMRGVHVTSVIERAYAMSDGTRRIVGRVDIYGKPVDGVELALDTVLKGSAGQATLVRDARGRSFESPTQPGVAPTPGHTVVLTINSGLQEIAERVLGDAVAKMGADGGDIVVLDPHSGEVRAMASRRADPRTTAATALSEPYEPGSTLKPFMAATLLARGKAREDEVIGTEGGVFKINGRTIRDLHKADRMTLAEVIAHSSNIGIVKFSQRLTAREQYEALRDFGFGMPTGVPYPSEASGRLPHPSHWSLQSPASLAMGYEIAVTPLQLANAYAAFANGGELLEPALVKEIREPDGKVLFRHERRVVRRVLAPAIADRMRRLLMSVVSDGTALQADVATFQLAGKTGTSRRTINGRYAASQYYATFVGLFPADRPQYVILVKLDSPQGSFYGGTTAAPVTKAVLEAAIAARDAALDRGALASVRIERPDTAALARQARLDSARLAMAAQEERDDASQQGATASAEGEGAALVAPPVARRRPQPEEGDGGSVPFTVELPAHPERPRAGAARAVPDVRGLDLRDAVRALHEAGFRVQLVRGGSGGAGTSPAPGTVARPGALVRLVHTP